MENADLTHSKKDLDQNNASSQATFLNKRHLNQENESLAYEDDYSMQAHSTKNIKAGRAKNASTGIGSSMLKSLRPSSHTLLHDEPSKPRDQSRKRNVRQRPTSHYQTGLHNRTFNSKGGLLQEGSYKNGMLDSGNSIRTLDNQRKDHHKSKSKSKKLNQNQTLQSDIITMRDPTGLQAEEPIGSEF